MRHALGKTFDLVAIPPADGSPAPVAAAPVVKVDVDETIVGVEGNILTVNLPPTSSATHNQLLELRAYVVPYNVAPPTTPDGYIDSTFPYAVVDVSDPAWAVGGPVAITLPVVDRVVPYHGQLVHGYAS